MSRTILIAILLSVASLTTVHAQTRDSIIVNKKTGSERGLILFPFNKAVIDSEYMSNAIELSRINDILSRIIYDTNYSLDSIVVGVKCSPDGDYNANVRLMEARAKAFEEYLYGKFPQLINRKLVIEKTPENWDGLRQMIANDPLVPGQKEALAIIDSIRNPTVREAKLNELKGGATNTYILNHFSRYLRNGSNCAVWYKVERDTIQVPITKIPKIMDKVIVAGGINPTLMVPAPTIRKPLFALKTNLLFDLATALNVEVEVPIGKQWSVAGELIFPWWLLNDKQYCLQLLSGNLEGRYWFGDRTNRAPLTGWFTGIYTGGGLYDLEWKVKGYQGEFFIAAGVSGGYAHKIKRNLSIEYSLGVGYLKTHYREYEPKMGEDNEWHLIRKKSGNYTWFGPTRAKISLVWMLNYKKEGGSI